MRVGSFFLIPADYRVKLKNLTFIHLTVVLR